MNIPIEQFPQGILDEPEVHYRDELVPVCVSVTYHTNIKISVPVPENIRTEDYVSGNYEELEKRVREQITLPGDVESKVKWFEDELVVCND